MSDPRNGRVAGRKLRAAADDLPEGFGRLLDWLDRDRDLAGEAYERIRRKLIRFFEWRGQPVADHLADKTIDRVAHKLAEGTVDRGLDPGAYFHGVARNILREQRSEDFRRREAIRELSGTAAAGRAERDPVADRELKRSECLDRCLLALSPSSRELILAYYQGVAGKKVENRRALADRLAIPMNALWIRAHRVRLQLERCIGACAAATGMKSIRIEPQIGQALIQIDERGAPRDGREPGKRRHTRAVGERLADGRR